MRAKGQRLSKNVCLDFSCFSSTEETLRVTTFGAIDGAVLGRAQRAAWRRMEDGGRVLPSALRLQAQPLAELLPGQHGGFQRALLDWPEVCEPQPDSESGPQERRLLRPPGPRLPPSLAALPRSWVQLLMGPGSCSAPDGGVGPSP